MPIPQNDKEAKKHWVAQEPSINRPFGQKDPGLIQVDGVKDVHDLLTRELEGQPTPVFRQKTASNIMDPLAELQKAIRAWTAGMDAATFKTKFVNDPGSFQLYLICYGEMPDEKKAAALHKLEKLSWERQKEALKQVNIDRNREDRQIKNTLENQKKLEKLLSSGAFGPVVDGTEVKRGDPQ